MFGQVPHKSLLIPHQFLSLWPIFGDLTCGIDHAFGVLSMLRVSQISASFASFAPTQSALVLAVATATVALAACFASTTASATTTFRLAHASSDDSLINKAVMRFADEVKQNTHGDITIKVYPAEQLGDEAAIAEGVGNGSIDIGLGGAVDAIDPRLNAVSLPFMFKDTTAVHHFLDSPDGKAFLAMGKSRGYVMLGALDSGFRQFADSKHAIKAPADLAGMKIRTPPNPVILATMKQLGALPQSLPLGTVYTSLQSGVVDGVEPELRDYYDQKWYEVAKYLSMSNYNWSANYWYMNSDDYKQLSPADRVAMDKAVTDTVAWYRAELDATYADVNAKLKTHGVQINTVDTAPFRAMVAPVYTQFGKTWGVDFVTKLKAEANAQ